jgi:N-acetylglucosamine-6-phosphate deacetylase
MSRAIDGGLRMITHLYSCTSTVTRDHGFRRLGVIETAFLSDELFVELIADGCHLPKGLLQLAYKIKGKDKICLITDGTRYAGLEGDDLKIADNDEKVIVRDGVAFMRDFSNFSGSIATTDRIVRTMYKLAEVPLVEVIQMATKNPARVMGLSDRGSLAEGYYADLVFFDDDINVSRVFIEGKELENV